MNSDFTDRAVDPEAVFGIARRDEPGDRPETAFEQTQSCYFLFLASRDWSNESFILDKKHITYRTPCKMIAYCKPYCLCCAKVCSIL